jgi:hypothetical protein
VFDLHRRPGGRQANQCLVDDQLKLGELLDALAAPTIGIGQHRIEAVAVSGRGAERRVHPEWMRAQPLKYG